MPRSSIKLLLFWCWICSSNIWNTRVPSSNSSDPWLQKWRAPHIQKGLSIFKCHDLGKTSIIYPVESKTRAFFFNSTGASSVVHPRRRSVPSSIAPGSARWMWSLPRKSSARCRSARCNARQTVVAAPSGAEVRQWRKWSWHDSGGSVIKVARWRFSSSQAHWWSKSHWCTIVVVFVGLKSSPNFGDLKWIRSCSVPHCWGGVIYGYS